MRSAVAVAGKSCLMTSLQSCYNGLYFHHLPSLHTHQKKGKNSMTAWRRSVRKKKESKNFPPPPINQKTHQSSFSIVRRILWSLEGGWNPCFNPWVHHNQTWIAEESSAFPLMEGIRCTTKHALKENQRVPVLCQTISASSYFGRSCLPLFCVHLIDIELNRRAD